MFVRWIVRGHKNSEVANVTFHDAYLVESYRDENGSPRQRTVTYLGNIREIDGEFPTIERELFLLRAEIILESLNDVAPKDRKQAIEQLQEQVQPLNEDEVMIGFRNTLRWYFQWWRDNGSLPSNDDIFEQIEQARETINQLRLND